MVQCQGINAGEKRPAAPAAGVLVKSMRLPRGPALVHVADPFEHASNTRPDR